MEKKKLLTRRRRSALSAPALVALAVLWIGCESDVAAEEQAEAAGDASVLATVGGESISRGEVETLVAAQLEQLERQRYEIVEQGLNQLVEEKLLEVEAAKRGVSVEELVQSEVTDKLTEVTDEDVDRFYDENQARIGQPKEAVAGQIRQYLDQQQGATLQSNLIQSLRSSLGVRSYLEPQRVEVAADGFPQKGGAEAPVTVVEFSDFECPFCSRVNPTLAQVTAEYGDKVRIVFRQFPLDNLHPNARKAAEASLCANDQGKFWEMHDTMFANQRQLGVEDLKRQAGEIGLAAEAFDECLDSGRYAAQVQADVEAASGAGVTGTPAFFINGRFLSGAQPFEAFQKVIDDELERASG